MKDGQKYLLLRYSPGPVEDCIEQHRAVLEKKGFCWFGKEGSAPSDRILTQVFDEQPPLIVLYRKNAAFICESNEYSFIEPPWDGIPRYYESEGIWPSIFFRLLSIDPCDQELFHNSIVVSTGAYVEDVVYHTNIPFMLCMYVDESKVPKLGANECRYRDNTDSFCNCRTCANYNCICEHPNTCAKQRR